MAVSQDGTPPIALGRSRQATLPVEPLSQEQVMLQALVAGTQATAAVTKAVAEGKGGPWAVALLVSLVVSGLMSGGLWGLHMVTGDRAILDRLDALEEAQDDREEHDEWVVKALVNLSTNAPLPPPPTPRRRRLRDR